MRHLLTLALVLLLALPAAAQPDGPLTIESQGSFFIGGRDVQSDTLSTLPAYAPSRHHHRRPDVCPLPGPGRAPGGRR